MKKNKNEPIEKEEIALTEEQIANNNAPSKEPKTELSIPWLGIIVIGVIIILMIVCIIIIGVNGGF